MSENSPESGKKGRGGRPKGVPNKRSWHMRRELEEHGFDPVAEFMAAYAALDTADKRVQALLSLFRHVYPQLNAVDSLPDPPADDDETHQSKRSTDELLALVTDES